jgi:type I restriction enzyme R subunit
MLLKEIFAAQSQRLNPGILDRARAEALCQRLERVLPRIEGNLEAWEYLRGLKTVFVPEEKRERNVRLLAGKWDQNTYHITDELRFYNGSVHIRLDVACFINGIPVLLVETKAATRLEGIAEALEQVRRYHREGPELLALIQVHTLTHLVQYYYGPTWNTSRKSLFNWKDESAAPDFESLVKGFLHPQRLARLLSDFILFTRKDDELSKVILRPHQMRAVERVVRRAAEPRKQRGLVWHTQGSGKTYTMIVAAKKIIEEPVFENPTVLMLVDRNELEAQLFGNLASLSFSHAVVAQSKLHLRQLLESDRRGLVVSMIHKFEEIPADINTRKNIFVLVDEAHRTTGGDLGNYLMGALPNATYLGFTGTPIDKTAYGKGTFKVFGVDDPQGYLDKYSIAQSIEDKTTVPLHYTLAPSELRVERQTLEREFLDLMEAEASATWKNSTLSSIRRSTCVICSRTACAWRGWRPTSPAITVRWSSRWATRRSWWRSTGRPARCTRISLTNICPRSIRRWSTARPTTMPTTWRATTCRKKKRNASAKPSPGRKSCPTS